MNKNTLILLLFIFSSCNKKESLDENFKKNIIEYQKKFPIPSLRSNDYVYTAYFSMIKKDTVCVLSRSSNGLMRGMKGFGVFQDEILQPTFVYDDDGLSKNFVHMRIINEDAKKLYLNLKNGIRESYPPIYTFLIKNKEIKLIKIDTIWRNWD